jgi:pimeloyl-ACP methyl ester carboxylesterase
MRTSRLLSLLLAVAGSAQAQTTSPFQPPEEELGVYVVNSGSGLDTGCTYRGRGPLIIKLKIPKVLNDKQFDGDGKLLDAQKLINNGVISAQAVIRFPVYDIDDKAVTGGTFAPEIDRVSFNGVFQKNLQGFNNTWTDDSLVIPIEDLKFGQDNELRIDIDTGNVGKGEYWCMAVDWVAAEFDVAYPYVLQHGISASETTWDVAAAPGVISALEDRGVLFTRFSLSQGQGGNGSVAGNAAELLGNVTSFLEPLKAKKVHVIAHSKGGLDTQAMQAFGPEFEILSLSTLSTPHLGSVSADMSIIQKQTADIKINTGADPNGFVASYINTWTFGQGPQLPGLADLTTYAATTALSMGLRGNISNTYTFGANADLNGDNDLTMNESAGLFPGAAHYAAERAWRVMRDFSSAPILSIVKKPGVLWGTNTVLTYATVLAPSPQPNDIVVTLGSANPGYGSPQGNVMANHSTIKSGALINQILDTTIPLQ